MIDDVERFRALFDDCYRPLYAYALRRTNSADADDVVSESFAVAWRRLREIPQGRELPWLYGVARRVLANRRRGVTRYLRLQARLASLPTYESPESGLDADVMAALNRLGGSDREVLRLAAWEDLGAAEIGLVLGCSENAAALRLSRARQRLRKLLTETSAIRTHVLMEDGDA